MLTSPPAENNAISISLSNDSSVNASTLYSLPLKVSSVPADFSDENKYRLFIGNFLSSNTFKNVLPTIPVAPTIAKFTCFIFTPPLFLNFINKYKNYLHYQLSIYYKSNSSPTSSIKLCLYLSSTIKDILNSDVNACLKSILLVLNILNILFITS